MNNHVGSADMYISLGTDPIVCFVRDANHNTDGSLDVLVVAPVMTDLDAAGGRDANGDDYEQLPKGNLDVTGKYFLWTTNLGGSRLDAFLVKIPAERLNGSPELSEVTTQNSEPCSTMPADAAPRGRGGSGCTVTGAHSSVRVSP